MAFPPEGGVSARVCIFCGSETDLTREHALPRWVAGVMPRQGKVDLTDTQHLESGLNGFAGLPSRALPLY